jgi:hypothetical protein
MEEVYSMSQAALLIAVRDHIKKHLKIRGEDLTDTWIAIMQDGKPMASSPQYFISVFEGGSRAGSISEVLDMVHSVNVTYSIKIANVAQDKVGEEIIIKAKYGLDYVSEWLATNIHLNQSIINRANEIIAEEPLIYYKNGFVEPLRYSSISAARIVGGDWFGAGSKEGPIGIIQTVSFGGARRTRFAEFQPTVGIDEYGNWQGLSTSIDWNKDSIKSEAINIEGERGRL